jgi:phototropin
MQFVGVQVDVTSKTEGTAVGDTAGVPLLVKYDTRIREQGKNAVNEINDTVQVPALQRFIVSYGVQ